MERYSCHDCPTRPLCLAAGLEPPMLSVLSDCILAGRAVRRGERLYRAGDAAVSCFVVRSGAFKTMVESGDGTLHVTGFHFPGELLGLSGQVDGRYRDSAQALDTSSACRLPLAELPTLWRLRGGASLLRLVGLCEHQGAEHAVNLCRPAADARVAGFLVSLGRRMKRLGRSERCLPTPMSRTDLANHLGMTLECLSRVLARLDRAGVISASRNQITCNDTGRLAALAGHLDH